MHQTVRVKTHKGKHAEGKPIVQGPVQVWLRLRGWKDWHHQVKDQNEHDPKAADQVSEFKNQDTDPCLLLFSDLTYNRKVLVVP